MNYEQFFPTSDFNNQCLPYAYVLTGLTAMSVMVLTCAFDSNTDKGKIEKLQEENVTLKRLIVKSIDKMLVRMLKNGYDIDNDDEE